MNSHTDADKLEVRIGDGSKTRAEARERIKALEDGEDIDDRHVLVLADEAELHRLLRPKNLELLSAIREYEPGSMREAADLVDRDIKDVHRNLEELESLNVVSFEQEGRAKRPVVRFNELDIEVSLTDVGQSAAPA